MIERSLISMYLDPKIRDAVRGYVEPWMWESPLYAEIVNILNLPEFNNVEPDEKLLHTLVVNSRVIETPNAYSEISSLIASYKPITGEYFGIALRSFENFVQERLIRKGLDLIVSKGMSQGIPIIKQACNVTIQPDEALDLSRYETISRLRLEEFPNLTHRPILSAFRLVNVSSSYKGYKYGDLAMIVAAPGVGKTTAMICEGASALKQGFRVYHMYMGDMSAYDAATKYIASLRGSFVDEVIEDPTKYLDQTTIERLSRLRVDAFPAFKYDAEQIVSRCRAIKRQFNYDMFILDYDSNVRLSQSESLYLENGYSYGLYKSLATSEKLVMIIGSQPKISYWDHEILPLDSAAESSRKQHVVDYVLTIGKRQGSSLLGTLHAAKVRRGQTGQISRLKRDYSICRLTEISQQKYDEIAQRERENLDSGYLAIKIDDNE